MADAEKEKAIRDFINALCKKDFDGAASFFADDATWTNSEGVFTGVDEIKNYIPWMTNTMTDLTFSDSGIGIAVDGDNAVYEYVMEGTYEGKRIKTNGVCTYQFQGNKCKRHFTVIDRLSLARQATSGFISRTAVNSIIGIMEKGLR
jgi:ketosteroid isomerase-like protein